MKKLIWCIGPEGMGHHMCQSIFEDLWQGKGKFDAQFPQIIHYWNNMVEDNLQFFFNDIMMKVSQSPHDVFVFTPSSPYDNPRDSIRRPDILEFYKQFKKIFDIRLIHTYRNPIEATYSLIRRGWFKTMDPRIRNQMLYQAKIVEDNLIYHKAHLKIIGESNWKTLHYESIVQNPESFLESLAGWTNVSRDIIERGLKKVTKPTEKTIPPNDLATLERFFTQERKNMWEPFFMKNKL